MAQKTLREELTKLSKAKLWPAVVREWYLLQTYVLEHGSQGMTCLCGHNPIKEICEIRNEHTLQQAIVGNCCVKNFLGIDSNKIFVGINKIAGVGGLAANYSVMNFDLLSWADKNKWISEKEGSFYLSVMNKRILSEKQRNWITVINKKVLQHVMRKNSVSDKPTALPSFLTEEYKKS